MNKRSNKLPPALKHGVYSGMKLLPLEDPAAFEKLHNDLIDEYVPSGCHEQYLIEDLARLIWRKRNLLTYRLVERANDAHSSIFAKANAAANPSFPMLPMIQDDTAGPRSAEEIRALYKAANERARAELGSALELVELDEVGTTDYLQQELDLHDRLDGMIDRVLKRLLFVRGLKSLSSTHTPRSQPRIGKVA
jgi:hypothetical protein